MTAIYSVKYYICNAALFNFGFLNLAMLSMFVFVCIVSFVKIFRVEYPYEILGAAMAIFNVAVIVMSFGGYI